MQLSLTLCSGKTSPESSVPKITPSGASSLRWLERMKPSYRSADGQTLAWCLDPDEMPRGVSSMLNISDWPNDASVCSLSRVLETGPIPAKYFLSAKACRGIVRRAEKRGKELPELLRHALEQVADSGRTSTSGGGLTVSQIETNYVSHCLNAGTFQNTGHGWWNESPVAQTIRTPDGSGSMEANVVAVASTGQTSHCLNAGGMGRIDYETETLVTGSLKVGGGKPGQGYPAAVGSFGVRRLTPVECEKLQGFEPGYTALDKAADGPRYKALGNSMAVPCVAFICDRIKRAIETWDNKENSRRTSGGLNLK